jgi:dTDP-4-dehydrorhamnose reductase
MTGTKPPESSAGWSHKNNQPTTESLSTGQKLTKARGNRGVQAKMIHAPPVLLIGGDSALARSLAQEAKRRGRPVIATTRRRNEAHADTRPLLDLADEASTRSFQCEIGDEGGTAVLLAAVSSIDACRQDPEGTRRVNVKHTLQLAAQLAGQGWRLILPSTNLVFNGRTPLPTPQTPTSPQTEYGRQKRDCEEGLAKIVGDSLVVRLGKIITPGMPLFRTWKEALRRNEQVQAFGDYMLAPLGSTEACRAILDLDEINVHGIFHLSPREELSYAQAAMVIATTLGLSTDIVHPISARWTIPDEQMTRHPALDPHATEALLGWDFSDSIACIRENAKCGLEDL